MYCIKCGKEIPIGKFCKYCGATVRKADSEMIDVACLDMQKDAVSIDKETKNSKKNGLIIVGVILIVCVALAMSFWNSSFSERKLRRLFFPGMKVDITENLLNCEIIEISNIEIEKGELEDTYFVTADTVAENDQARVFCQLEATIGKVERNWVIDKYRMSIITNIIPLVGAQPTLQLVEDTIKEFYPEINWGYKEIGRIGFNDLNYDFPILCDFCSRDTQLEQKRDSVVYRYSFETYTAKVTGQVVINFNFLSSGIWEVETVEFQDEEIAWDISGQWKFRMFMDWDIIFEATILMDNETLRNNNVLNIILTRESLNYIENYMEKLPVRIEDRCIYIEPFYTSGEEIVLTVKLDDFYFLKYYIGGSYECPMGGAQ